MKFSLPISRMLRTGAGGALGTAELARAKPDGYTLLLAFDSNIVVAPTVLTTLTYHPLKDFQPIAKLFNLPIMVVAHPSVKANNIKEFIEQSKIKPSDITDGTTGIGNTMHLAGELLRTKGTKPGRYLGYTRYDRMAEAPGCHGEYVETPDQLRPALERAQAAVRDGRTAVVNIKTDPDAGALTAEFTNYVT